MKMLIILTIVLILGAAAWWLMLHFLVNVPREVRICIGMVAGYGIATVADTLYTKLFK